jgi:hypothetical protein
VLVRASAIHLSNRTDVEHARVRQNFNDQGVALDRTAPGMTEYIYKIGDEINGMYEAQGLEQLRLAAINDQYIEKLAAQMPERDAATFRKVYKELVFRRVYPDSSDPQRLVEDMMKHPAVGDDLQALLDQHWLMFRREYDATCAAMEKESTAWDEKYALTAATNGWKKHIAALTELANMRIALNEAIVEKFMALVPPATAANRQDAVGNWREVVIQTRDEIKGPAWQRPSMR